MDEIKPVACVDPVDLARISEPRETVIFAPEYKSSDDVMLYDQQAIDTLRAEVEAHKLNIDLIKDCAAGSLNMGRGLIAEYAARAERAEAEAEALRKDAERYRWLRHGDNDEAVIVGPVTGGAYLLRNEKLDAAIDAAKQEAE